MLDDLRMAFTKPARHTHKGRGPRPDQRPDQRPNPSPAAASRKPD
jgi:ribonuclease P protein component